LSPYNFILPIYQRTVTPQGLEPRLIGPKPIVLPLDERVISGRCRIRTYGTLQYNSFQDCRDRPTLPIFQKRPASRSYGMLTGTFVAREGFEPPTFGL
jgi:hypothetical protein